MTTLIRPLAMSGFRQTLTLPTAGYSQTVQAYLWGAGGGAGGSDGGRPGGAGTGGGYVSAAFTVNPGDVVELTVGSAGWSGRASSVKDNFTIPLFNTRTAIPIGSTTTLPDASSTFVARWSGFLNNFGVWNTGTALNGSTTSLANTLNFDQSYSVNFPFTIDYLFNIAAYYEAAVYIDGELLFSSGLDSWKTQESGGVPFIANITAGNHTVRIVANANAGASYGVFGVGVTIASTTSAGSGGLGLVRDIFNTRDTVASPPLVIPNIQILIDEGLTVADGIWSNLQNDYGMWEADARAPSCSRTYTNVYFPYTGTYQIQMSAANTVSLSIDGVPVYTTPGSTSWTTAFTIDYTVTQGYHTVSFNATYTDPKVIGAVAILISKSWSGATGGLAGPTGSSGGGGGSGAATTLVLNPRTVNETLIAVAVGGAGGGGAGNSTTGIGEATAPGPRGRTAAGVSSPQTGQDQGDVYKDGGGGGAGGPGGPGGAGKNGFSSVGDSYAQAGTVGLGYLNPVATGTVIDPTNVGVAFSGPYYNLLPDVGRGASPGELQAKHGGAVFIFTSFGPRVRTDAGWQEVITIFVNVNGVWQQIDGMYVNEAGVWEPVVGTFVPAFEPLSNDFGILARPADHREIPPPPARAPVYDAIPRTGCFVQGTTITMADGSTKSIENVEIGDQLLGKDGVVNTVLEYVRPILGNRSLIAFNGQGPFMTSDHPVLMADGTWKSIDPVATNSKYPELADLNIKQLIVGDTIATPDGTGFKIESIQAYRDKEELQLYNFSLNGNNTYVADNLVVHNKGCVGSASTGVSCGCGCFVEGTKITMADGSIKSIEDIAIGEQLIGKDGVVNTVLEYLRPVLGNRTLIAFNGGVPFITDDHPVLMKDGTWKSVDPTATLSKYVKLTDRNIGQLTIGDTIATPDGAGFEIVSIERHQDREDLQLYNFSLDGNHTYVANNLVVHNKCFIAGTEVLMQDGTWKNIEDVKIDEVLIGKDGSENQILRLHRPTLGINDHWLPHKQRMVSINNSEFATSEDHMFFTTTGWKAPDAESCNLVHKHTIEAEGFTVTQLQIGDFIVRNDGNTVEVTSIEFQEDDPELQLYNFWTNGNHTYHVRMKDSQDGMLVHNKCFIAGTKVLMQDGTWKNIEDVDSDEVLIGQDGSENQIIRLHRPKLGVNDHWLPRKQRMVSINGSEFATSEDHMFFTATGWKAPDAESSNLVHKHTIEAEGFTVTQLQVGDKIITDSGDTVEVMSMEFREDDPELQLYNFWTNGNHTYHVRLPGYDQGMLVHNKCFIAGTEVLMQDGTWKNIEDVQIDEVLIGKDGSKNQILKLHRPQLGINDHWLPRKQRMTSINGSEFSVSDDHMFFTTAGWKAPDAEISNLIHEHTIAAEGFTVTQLQVGDFIVADNGDITEVISIEFRDDAPDLQLYNFWTNGNHTYHVRMKGVDQGMLVHNKCFIAGSKVLMHDGTWKNIEDVNIGDWVYNFDQTKINQVLFVETQLDNNLGFLYSPDQQHQPFATANHPLYVNGKLSSLDPEKIYNSYPWIDKTELIEPTNTAPPNGSTVYNLWTDNDHTFTVNGYGTLDMVSGGGVLRLMVEQGLIPASRANELIIKFDGLGKNTVYGLYALSRVLGTADISSINKLTAWVFADDSRPVAQKMFYNIARAVGSVICLIKRR